MFSRFFESKFEKEIKSVCQPGMELELRYSGGDTITVSQVIKIYRDSIVLLGFFAKLKVSELQVRIIDNGISFDTVIKRKGTDSKGNALFYCSMPVKLNYPKKRPEIFRIYPNGSCKILVSTNRGEKSVVLSMWALSESAIYLANKTNVNIKIGTKLFQALATVGTMGAQLCNMQVAKIRNEKHPDGDLSILSCLFTSPPRALPEMLSQAKSLAPKPKPKPKPKKK